MDLTYILTTKNKLPYLRQSITALAAHKRENEEIIVSDGGSTDGTPMYLQELRNAGVINAFVSKPDAGESHGLNKLALMARGELIRPITDDDVFHFPSISLHREFMLAHPEIDFLSSNGGFKNQNPAEEPRPLDYTGQYRRWMADGTPFSFCGLSTMFRRSSIPLIGLWNPSFRRADAEFSLRITAGKANIAWHTGYSYVNVSNPQSVSIVYMKKIKDETDRLNKFYLGKNPDPFIIERFKALKNKLQASGKKAVPLSREEFLAQWPTLAHTTDGWLERMNATRHSFLWKH